MVNIGDHLHEDSICTCQDNDCIEYLEIWSSQAQPGEISTFNQLHQDMDQFCFIVIIIF